MHAHCTVVSGIYDSSAYPTESLLERILLLPLCIRYGVSASLFRFIAISDIPPELDTTKVMINMLEKKLNCRKKNKVGKLLIKKKPTVPGGSAEALPEKKYRDRAAERRSKFGVSEPIIKSSRPKMNNAPV